MTSNDATAAGPSATAEEDLVRQHLPLVGYLVTEALRGLPDHVRRDDLTSAGMLALAQAARSYDPSLGVPFGRYAAPRIRGAFIDELRSTDWASRGARARARRVDEVTATLTASLHRAPTREEVASALGGDPADVERSRSEVHRAVVMSLQGLSEEGDAGAELVREPRPGPEAAVLSAERLGYLRDSVAELPDRLRAVVNGYFYDDKPMSLIAAELGVTESRVSQMCSEALGLVREAMTTVLAPEQAKPDPDRGPTVARRREAYVAAVAGRSSVAARIALDAYGAPKADRPPEWGGGVRSTA